MMGKILDFLKTGAERAKHTADLESEEQHNEDLHSTEFDRETISHHPPVGEEVETWLNEKEE